MNSMSEQAKLFLFIFTTLAVFTIVLFVIPKPLPPSSPTLTETIPTPTEMPSMFSSLGDGIVCLGTENGANCLMQNGEWVIFNQEMGLQDNKVVDMVICPDETIVLAGEKTIDLWTGNAFSYQDKLSWVQFSPIKSIVCDNDNAVWVAHGFGPGSRVARLDNKSETWTELENLSLEGLHYSRLAVAPDGRVWFISAKQVAQIDGDSWVIYKRGDGAMPDVDYTFHSITFDPDSSYPVIIESDGLLKFNGEAWKYTPVNNLKAYSVENVVHGDETLFVASGTNRLREILLSNDSIVDSALVSDAREVRAVEQDEQGRLYLATSWGLWVFDGSDDGSYFMHNSDLVDNRITTIAVLGDGPTLPAYQSDKVGQVRGRIVRHGEPVPNAQIEICVEDKTVWTDAPCTNQPIRYTAITNGDGEYVIENVKVGYYFVSILDDTRWRKIPKRFEDGRYDTNETAFFLIGESEMEVDEYDLGK